MRYTNSCLKSSFVLRDASSHCELLTSFKRIVLMHCVKSWIEVILMHSGG